MSTAAAEARWATFLGKIEARLAEIVAEAEEGLTGLVDEEVLDSGPLGNALSELKARLMALSRKVDDAWSNTISPELDKADAGEVLERELRRAGQTLRDRIDQAYEDLEVAHSARAARKLHELARAEMEGPQGGRTCAKCGAPITPEEWLRPSNVTCVHCQAINTVRPGHATVMFFQGGALHALGREAAKVEAAALAQAERRFKALVHPVERDASGYLRALKAYWRAHCAEQGRWTPGWTAEQLEPAAAIKVSQAWAWLEPERPKWKRRAGALAMASAGDVAGLRAFLAGEGKNFHVDVEELIELAQEQNAAKAMETLLGMAWEDDGGEAPREAWVAEKRREAALTMARRRG